MRETRTLACMVILALGLAAGATGCAPAEADPLDVTYYYLPG